MTIKNYVLIPGPPVRASSWQPTAECLKNAGASVQVPDVLGHRASPPSWAAWTRHVLELIDPTENFVVVGHSSACALAAELATKVPVRAVIFVDGDIPPTQGPVLPVRPALREFIRGLGDKSGTLPIWSRWFDDDPARASLVGLDALRRDALAYAHFETGLPKLTVDWFNDEIKLERWDHVPAGYIQTSKIYDHASAEAQLRGLAVINLNGTHLDPSLRPVEMSAAIMAMSHSLAH
jgi:pimeloyl-ACP methyl ester carboxylesterase